MACITHLGYARIWIPVSPPQSCIWWYHKSYTSFIASPADLCHLLLQAPLPSVAMVHPPCEMLQLYEVTVCLIPLNSPQKRLWSIS